MNRDFTHHHEALLEREDRDVPALVELDWHWNDGEQLTYGGLWHDRGWYCFSIVARDPESHCVISLTEREAEIITEECHPDALENGRDAE